MYTRGPGCQPWPTPAAAVDKVLETWPSVYPHEGHAVVAREGLDLLLQRLEILLLTDDEEDVEHRRLREVEDRGHHPGVALDEALDLAVLDQRPESSSECVPPMSCSSSCSCCR